jgi:hypothetical protein
MLQLEGVRHRGDGKMSNSVTGLNDCMFQFRVQEEQSKGMNVVWMSTDVEY